MYKFKDNLSKEENLRLSEEFSNKADDLLSRWEELQKEINQLVPLRTVGLSKAKIQKLSEPTAIIERLILGSRSHKQIKDMYESQERMILERAKKEEEAQKLKQKEAERAQYLNDAIAYCIANGKSFGKDFTIENAIDTADYIRFEKEIDLKKEGPSLIEFEGDSTCDYNCPGWNMEDRRCECGNRRVGWTYSGDFKQMWVYAEAW